jgi:hypothetical protein
VGQEAETSLPSHFPCSLLSSCYLLLPIDFCSRNAPQTGGKSAVVCLAVLTYFCVSMMAMHRAMNDLAACRKVLVEVSFGLLRQQIMPCPACSLLSAIGWWSLASASASSNNSRTLSCKVPSWVQHVLLVSCASQVRPHARSECLLRELGDAAAAGRAAEIA